MTSFGVPNSKVDGEAQRDKARQPKKIYTSGFVSEKTIVEQINDEDNCPAYLMYDRKTGEMQKAIGIQREGNEICLPIRGDEVTKGIIKLPTEVKPYGTQEELLKDIEIYLNKYLDVPEEHRKICAWTALKSWAYDKFTAVNYLRCLGDYGTGKSRYIKVNMAIHYKGTIATGATSSAALYRHMNRWHGSVGIDEADRQGSEETEEIMKIINQGIEKGFSVWRCDPNDKTQNEYHDVFCPKVLSSRKPFDDKATESRCFSVTMQTTRRKDILPNLNEEFEKEALDIRNKCLQWRFDHYDKIDPNSGNDYDFGNIEPRLRQISVGFIPLFIHNKELLEEFKTYIQTRQKEFIENRSESWEGRIVRAIAELIVEKKDNTLTASEIIFQADLRDRKSGELVYANAVSKYMQSLGFGKPYTSRDKESGKVVKKYEIPLESLLEKLPLYVVDSQELVTMLPLLPCYAHTSEMVTNGQKQLVTNVVTINKASLYDGYNGYMVTKNEDVVSVVQKLSNTENGGLVAREFIGTELPDWSDERIDEALEQARQKGDLYEPKHSFWRSI